MRNNYVDAIKDWNPDRPALFYVIDRNGGGIISKFKVRTRSRAPPPRLT